jgi:hypothetical protein
MALKELFKRKVGGTMVGNLLRKGAKLGANAIMPGSGSLVGNGVMKISQTASERRDKTGKSGDKDAIIEGLQTNLSAPVASALLVGAMQEDTSGTNTNIGAMKSMQVNIGNSETVQKIKSKLPIIVLGAGVLTAIIYLIKRKK